MALQRSLERRKKISRAVNVTFGARAGVDRNSVAMLKNRKAGAPRAKTPGPVSGFISAAGSGSMSVFAVMQV